MNQIIRTCRVLLSISLLGLLGCQPIQPEVAPEPQEVTILAGAGQDVVAINAFFPDTIRIRVGDMITWKINSNEPHIVTFLSGEPMPPDPIPIPGGGPTDVMLNPALAFPSRAPDAPVETYDGTAFRNSGFLSDGTVVPPGEDYSLIFETPGTYEYICGIHPATMTGKVIVEPATATDLPTAEEIAAQAEAEMAPLLEMAEVVRADITNPDLVRSEPGPNGTTIWYVPAGRSGLDPRVEIYDFFPKDLTVQQGDTVIWTSVFFHQVIFHPGQPVPQFVIPEPQDAGPPVMRVNPDVAFPAKPAGEFDGTGLYSSGLIGVPAGMLPGGTTFAMTFSEPGSYDYVCATHQPLGMEGTVTVVSQ